MKNNEWAVITGASSGIGKSLAEEFAKHNFNILVVAKNEKSLIELCREIGTTHKVVTKYIKLDLTKNRATKILIDHCRSINTKYLINNAGIEFFDNSIEKGSKKHEKLIQSNVDSIMKLTFEISKYMKEHGGGYIGNVSSTASYTEKNMSNSVHGATKSFIEDFTNTTNESHKENNTNVKVGIIKPGMIDTEWQPILTDNEEIGRSERLRKLQTATPEQFAKFAITKILKGKTYIIYGSESWLYRNVVSHLPSGIKNKILNKDKK